MHILFVSDEDLCRAPMARALANQLAKSLRVQHATFHSCGLSVPSPKYPTVELVHFLAFKEINLRKHLSTPFQLSLVRNHDLILCMTHQQAAAARSAVGAPQSGKILVLNDAISFGNSPAKQNILPPPDHSEFHLMALYSQLKASVGRLVRNLSDGDEVEDFGAKRVEATERGPLDDPRLRQFLNHNILEYLQRAFQPATPEDVAEHLQALGQKISAMEIEELLKTDLKNRVIRRPDATWEPDSHAQEREEAERAKQKAASQSESQSRSRRPADPEALYGGTMDEATALTVLSITLNTPRDEARKSIKKLLTRYHPDKFHDDEEFRVLAEEKTKQINQAWALLEKKLPE